MQKIILLVSCLEDLSLPRQLINYLHTIIFLIASLQKDISKLGLSKLRSSIGIIPQSPTLYGGLSVRDNLDPFKENSDADVCAALTCVSMLSSLPRGLDTIVTDGGSNFR